MGLAAFLVLFPFLIAGVLSLVKSSEVRKGIVYASSVIIIASSVGFAAANLSSELPRTCLVETGAIDKLMLLGEILLMCLIVYQGVRHKRYFVILLSMVQTLMVAVFELSGHHAEAANHIYIDRLAVIMCLIIGIIGPLIAVYAIGYMHDYVHHHTEYADRRRFFLSMLFVFLGAMFGLVLSANLIWIYFFWEITSVVSFLLIGYTKTKEAETNSFRALWMNLLGGLGFAIAIVYGATQMGVVNLQDFAGMTGSKVLLPVALLAFAGLTKSAQLPFTKWLLGAMVAPTPSSALLHSATMVKAGVYLLLRLAPVMSGTRVGNMVALVGGFTFLITSMLAITVSDGKKVLAYSTVSNLGLITACAGVGTGATVWAGIFLMIFHAVSKSMLFQTVGAIENTSGSRDVEDMHGLIIHYPKLAIFMVIGIAGMFLAPFGMLISKWAALKSFVDAGNVILVMFLCFGSATTLFYWTKWLAKILACPRRTHETHDKTKASEWVSICSHAVMMIGLCALFPVISIYLLQPHLVSVYGEIPAVLSMSDMVIMIVLLAAVFVVPGLSYLLSKRMEFKEDRVYMSGINVGDHRSFYDSHGQKKDMYLANWYMLDFFGEDKLWVPSLLISAGVIIYYIIVTIGGAL